MIFNSIYIGFLNIINYIKNLYRFAEEIILLCTIFKRYFIILTILLMIFFDIFRYIWIFIFIKFDIFLLLTFTTLNPPAATTDSFLALFPGNFTGTSNKITLVRG